MKFGLNLPRCFLKKNVIFVAECLVHWTLMLEALGSIHTAGEKNLVTEHDFLIVIYRYKIGQL